jgi:CheY-like chemotaxis protein
MEEERELRIIASRLVEKVGGLTSLICSMEDHLKTMTQDNKLLRQQIHQLNCSMSLPSLNESVLCSNEDIYSPVDEGMFSLPSAPDSESETVFISSPLADPMIYELEPGHEEENEPFEDMFDFINSAEGELNQSAVIPLPRLSRRLNRRASGPLRILAVEDDPFCQQLIRRIVNSLNIGEIEIVADGVDAVINMSTSSFDLILMDIQLPRLDGLQATQSIRKFNRRTPIVSMTSQVAAEDLKRYFEGGIDEVLPKPFDRQAVMRVIDQFFKLNVS